MKKLTLLLMALGLGVQMGFAQGNRIVCDETCRIEYQKTETSVQKQAETAKAVTSKPAVKTTSTKQTPPKAAEKGGNGDIRDDVFYGTLEEIDDYFRKQNWTDGLPFVR